MPIYQGIRALNAQEIEALMAAWPQKADGSMAIHADLVAEVDFSTAVTEVTNNTPTNVKNAGVKIVADTIAPTWVIVELPADAQVDGTWATFWEDWAKDLVSGQGAEYVEKVEDGLELDENNVLIVVSKSGTWKIRDRKDRWIGATGYLTRIGMSL